MTTSNIDGFSPHISSNNFSGLPSSQVLKSFGRIFFGKKNIVGNTSFGYILQTEKFGYHYYNTDYTNGLGHSLQSSFANPSGNLYIKPVGTKGPLRGIITWTRNGSVVGVNDWYFSAATYHDYYIMDCGSVDAGISTIVATITGKNMAANASYAFSLTFLDWWIT